ncbi:MAG: C39 family peptidase [Candidatus Limnocylindrales bacterium]
MRRRIVAGFAGLVLSAGVFGAPVVSADSLPATPTNTTAVAISTSQILFSWEENDSSVTSFYVTDSLTGVALGATARSYIWPGLAPNTWKCFFVTAKNASGQSDWSEQACASTLSLPSVPVPAPPTHTSAVAISTSQILISWRENSNQTNFLVSDGVTDVVVSGYARSYIWPGLAPNTLKCFTVTAKNASGQSPRSDQACTSTLRWPARYQILLPVPYLSQYQQNPKTGSPIDRVDCGPTATAMVLQYRGKRPAHLSDVAWVLQVRARTKVSDTACHGGPCDTTAPQLEAALRSYGVTYSEVSRVLEPAPDAQLVAIHAALASGKPVIALVHGYDLGRGAKNLGDPGYYGDHWIVVTGFTADGQYAFVNDPDNEKANGPRWIKGGAQIKVPTSTLGTAMMDTDGGPFYGIIVN